MRRGTKTRRSRPWGVVLLAVLAALGFGGVQARAAVIVSGEVSDGQTHRPVPDAVVSLYSLLAEEPVGTVSTLANGSFTLKAPAAGRYRIEVDAATEVKLRQWIEIPASGMSFLRLSLEGSPVLRVKLLRPDGSPDSADPADDRIQFSLTTDWQGEMASTSHAVSPDGSGTIEESFPTDHPTSEVSSLVIVVRDPSAGCGELRLQGWPRGVVLLRLNRGRILRGIVVDRYHQARDGVPVTVIRATAQGTPIFDGAIHTTTGSGGQFIIPALFADDYLVQALIPGAGWHIRHISLAVPRRLIRISPADTPCSRSY